MEGGVKGSGTVAVIMRTKNRPLLLRRAIESVVRQTAPDWVLSIVNDGGDPAPVNALIEEFSSQARGTVVVTHHPESTGMEAASNAAIQAVDSTYCVVHDDDDAWDPQFLAQTTAFMEGPDCPEGTMGVITQTMVVTERIENDQVFEISRDGWFRNGLDLTLWNMCGGNLFPPIAFLYRRKVYEEIGTYDPKLPVLGDWEFNLRFMRKYDIGKIHSLLAFYHLRTSASEAYLGTVTHQMAVHDHYRTLLRNRLLRQDLDKGEVGLGVLISLSHAIGLEKPTAGMPEDAARQIAEAHEILVHFNQTKARAAKVAARLPLAKGILRRIRGSS